MIDLSKLNEEFEKVIESAGPPSEQVAIIEWLVDQLLDDELWTQDYISQHDKNRLEDLVSSFFDN